MAAFRENARLVHTMSWTKAILYARAVVGQRQRWQSPYSVPGPPSLRGTGRGRSFHPQADATAHL
jgi:hypothetical protein